MYSNVDRRYGHPTALAGRLVQVLKDWSLPSAENVAVYPERTNLSAKVSAFVDFLIEWFKRDAA